MLFNRLHQALIQWLFIELCSLHIIKILSLLQVLKMSHSFPGVIHCWCHGYGGKKKQGYDSQTVTVAGILAYLL